MGQFIDHCQKLNPKITFKWFQWLFRIKVCTLVILLNIYNLKQLRAASEHQKADLFCSPRPSSQAHGSGQKIVTCTTWQFTFIWPHYCSGHNEARNDYWHHCIGQKVFPAVFQRQVEWKKYINSTPFLLY